MSSTRRSQLRVQTVSVLAMVLDHGRVQPNPARDKLIVKMPREERRELQPPTAEHIEAVVRLLPPRYRLPTLVLDATGMRIGELEALTWGDLDEPRQRWRVSGAVSKTGRARWVPVPIDLFQAVTRLVAREDRVPERPVFQGFGADRFRTAITRACTAAGVPQFSPHDLRHRRVSLLHLGGMPWARIGELVGHDDLVTTARTYTHVVADERELATKTCSLPFLDRDASWPLRSDRDSVVFALLGAFRIRDRNHRYHWVHGTSGLMPHEIEKQISRIAALRFVLCEFG
jgi:integrase